MGGNGTTGNNQLSLSINKTNRIACTKAVVVLDEATLVAVTPTLTAVAAGELNVAFVAVPSRSSFDELLAAVDVEGRAGDRGVRHEVDGQCGDVGRADDAADRQRGTELLAALVDLVAEQ